MKLDGFQESPEIAAIKAATVETDGYGAGTFSVPRQLWDSLGRRREVVFPALSSFYRAWCIRAVTSAHLLADGERREYTYWIVYRREPGESRKQKSFTISRDGEWTPTDGFLAEFNRRWAHRQDNPDRGDVMVLVDKHRRIALEGIADDGTLQEVLKEALDWEPPSTAVIGSWTEAQRLSVVSWINSNQETSPPSIVSSDEQLFEELSSCLVGRTVSLEASHRVGEKSPVGAIMRKYGRNPLAADSVLTSGGFFPCAVCGTWNYHEGETCEDCTPDGAEGWQVCKKGN